MLELPIKKWNLNLVRLEHINTILRKRTIPKDIGDEYGENVYSAYRLVNVLLYFSEISPANFSRIIQT